MVVRARLDAWLGACIARAGAWPRLLACPYDVRVPQYRRRAFVIVLLTLWIICRALTCPCLSVFLVNSA
jgi:hypothetical protein